jgi:hypothetical protein
LNHNEGEAGLNHSEGEAGLNQTDVTVIWSCFGAPYLALRRQHTSREKLYR